MDTNLYKNRLDTVLRHIKHVQDNAFLLGERLIDRGEIELGRGLIKNGQVHDNSKLSGIEWLYLHADVKDKEPEKFELAAQMHITTNCHHPEYWGTINEVPRIYVAEMVCDWAARSSEFGNDVRQWIKESATKKYQFKTSGKVFKEVKEFLELLLDPSFK